MVNGRLMVAPGCVDKTDEAVPVISNESVPLNPLNFKVFGYGFAPPAEKEKMHITSLLQANNTENYLDKNIKRPHGNNTQLIKNDAPKF
jgi:hypothetical protein